METQQEDTKQNMVTFINRAKTEALFLYVQKCQNVQFPCTNLAHVCQETIVSPASNIIPGAIHPCQIYSYVANTSGPNPNPVAKTYHSCFVLLLVESSSAMQKSLGLLCLSTINMKGSELKSSTAPKNQAPIPLHPCFQK